MRYWELIQIVLAVLKESLPLPDDRTSEPQWATWWHRQEGTMPALIAKLFAMFAENAILLESDQGCQVHLDRLKGEADAAGINWQKLLELIAFLISLFSEKASCPGPCPGPCPPQPDPVPPPQP